MPQRDRLGPAQPDRAQGVVVVERSREGDHADPRCHQRYRLSDSSTRTAKVSITVLASSVSAASVHLGQPLVGELAVDLELEPFALPDGETAVARAAPARR